MLVRKWPALKENAKYKRLRTSFNKKKKKVEILRSWDNLVTSMKLRVLKLWVVTIYHKP